MSAPRFTVGDRVVPKPEWIGNVPSGIVRAIAPWGKDGALYVGDEKRAFAADVFDLAPADAAASADWSRCLNNHFGGTDTAVFLDPPYRSYERLYGDAAPVADAVESWARDNAGLRIALCGHVDDYDLPGWDRIEWSRGRLTYSGSKTTDLECVWYSPACLPRVSLDLFAYAPERDAMVIGRCV